MLLETEQTFVAMELRLQKLHLVRQYAAIGERQELRPVRDVRDGEQSDPGLFGRAAALAGVAVLARGDDV